MAELETRVISGKGLLRVNKDTLEFEKGRVFTLYASVIRRPFNEFLNFNYNPPRGRYASLVFLRGGHVVDTRAMEYPDQSWDFHLDPAAQVLYAVKCSYAGVLQTFFNLGNALSLPSISITNNIEDWFHIDLMWDEVKVVCYADTAIRLRLESADYDLCPDDSTPVPKPPPPPPETAPSVPPGTPLEETSTPADEAYDGENDGGDTEPLPGDSIIPPPETIGDNCVAYTLTTTVTYIPVGGTEADTLEVERSSAVYGEVRNSLTLKVGDPSVLQTFHRGNPFLGGCGDYLLRDIVSLGAGATILEWTPPVLS